MDSIEHDNVAIEDLENEPESVNSSIGKKRARSTYSEVWEYFQKNEVVEGEKQTCYCKECKKSYIWGGKYGTSNLRKHIPRCSMISAKTLKQNQTIFNQNRYRDLMAKAIIRHNLPFMFVHYEGIRDIHSYLNDKVVSFSRNTSRTDVLKLYEKEKSKLKCFLKTCTGRISLTTDLWTSVNTDGYITLTAHFIDNKWNIQKKLLNFCLMPPPHSGAAIFGKISSLLLSWDIEDKIFAYTLDNASSNDKFVELLESHLTYRKALVANGEYLHVRCTAHILNLMVQDGLKCIASCLSNIRESIKYIKGSQSRKKYPVLSIMAKDILAVPITTVASESAFSISGRVLDDYRSSLKDDIVEALLCTRDWLYGNAIATEVEQEDEDISKFHVDAEQLTQFPTPSLGDP